MADVFLSYSRQDEAVVGRLKAALREHEISFWSATDQILPGMHWANVIEEELLRARAVIAVVSRASTESRWIKREWELALEKGIILPVIIDGSPPPNELGHIHAVDLSGWTGNSGAPAFNYLLRGIRYKLSEGPAANAGDVRRLREEERRARTFLDSLLAENLGSEIRIEGIELTDVGFYRDLVWSLSPQVNVLLGRNGYGKSLLLRSIVSLLVHDDECAYELHGKGQGSVDVLRGDTPLKIHFAEYFDKDESVGQIPLLAIPDARFIDRSAATLGPPADDAGPSDLARRGAFHFMKEQPYQRVIDAFLYSMCLDYFEANRSFERPLFRLIERVMRRLTDETFAFHSVERSGRERFTLLVKTEGKNAPPLPIQKVSQGTLSVLAILGLIHDYLKALRSEREVTQRRGIVVIDELDAHLHPAWQQKIVPILRESFPNVQFLLSGHSPLIVAGCLEDEVSVLRRKDGAFTLTAFPNDFVGWRPEEIYERIFQVEEMDDSYARFNALRPFRDKIEQEAEALRGLRSPTGDDVEKLGELENQLHYIDKAEARTAQRTTVDELQREVRDLRRRLEASGGSESEGLRAKLSDLSLRLESATLARRRLLALATLFAIAFSLSMFLWGVAR